MLTRVAVGASLTLALLACSPEHSTVDEDVTVVFAGGEVGEERWQLVWRFDDHSLSGCVELSVTPTPSVPTGSSCALGDPHLVNLGSYRFGEGSDAPWLVYGVTPRQTATVRGVLGDLEVEVAPADVGADVFAWSLQVTGSELDEVTISAVDDAGGTIDTTVAFLLVDQYPPSFPPPTPAG